MAIEMTAERFDDLVADAIDQVPAALLAQLQNCVIAVDDEPPHPGPEILGLYDGIPLPQRDSWYSGVVPDRITVFRGPLLRHCRDETEVVAEVRITVLHEIAHFFGFDDDQLDALGYP